MNHTNSEPLLEVRNLKKYFGKKGRILHAVDDISVSIGRGKTLGVVGESGCGKSTLGRTVLRLLEPTGGQILFEGKDITHVGKSEMRRYRQSMQIVFQDPYSSLNPRKSVAEIIATPLKVNHICKSRADLQKRVRELMDTVGLAERLYDAYPHELDGGRRQRVGIARALALNPEFVVCDEPVSALDVSIQAQVLNLLKKLQQQKGLTYMFVTHDMSVVRHISDDICVMYLGQVVEKCSSKELFRNPLHPYTRALLSAIPSVDIHNPIKREILRGEITSPIDPKPGCRFAPRCSYACPVCFEKNPDLTEVRPQHMAACHRVEEINPNT